MGFYFSRSLLHKWLVIKFSFPFSWFIEWWWRHNVVFGRKWWINYRFVMRYKLNRNYNIVRSLWIFNRLRLFVIFDILYIRVLSISFMKNNNNNKLNIINLLSKFLLRNKYIFYLVFDTLCLVSLQSRCKRETRGENEFSRTIIN